MDRQPVNRQDENERALRIVRSMAVNGPGPGTTPEQTLTTIAAFIDKRLARAALAPAEEPLPPCDCRANDWVEGDNGAIRCVQCGGYTGEPGTSIRTVPVADLQDFEDRANPCPCPEAVIELLDLAVRYAEASFGSERTDVSLGAHYVKTFMEQPAEAWCSFLAVSRG